MYFSLVLYNNMYTQLNLMTMFFYFIFRTITLFVYPLHTADNKNLFIYLFYLFNCFVLKVQ